MRNLSSVMEADSKNVLHMKGNMLHSSTADVQNSPLTEQ